MQIPMTAPVSVLVEPVAAKGCSADMDDGSRGSTFLFTMAFYLPAPFEVDPPEPIDPLVSIEFRPPINILAR